MGVHNRPSDDKDPRNKNHVIIYSRQIVLKRKPPLHIQKTPSKRKKPLTTSFSLQESPAHRTYHPMPPKGQHLPPLPPKRYKRNKNKQIKHMAQHMQIGELEETNTPSLEKAKHSA